MGQVRERDDAAGIAVTIGLRLEPRRFGEGVIRETEGLNSDPETIETRTAFR
jgi:hypothetical protein